MWNGERRTETLPYPQTAKGIKAAADLRAQVKSLIKHGVLDEQRYAELWACPVTTDAKKRYLHRYDSGRCAGRNAWQDGSCSPAGDVCENVGQLGQRFPQWPAVELS
ncbi:Arm DNA-binding domain-containing protein [Pseudomonas sp. CES]|uniref:Arm DNA-binding domain-containing protein n=1 Tax=Pseudomonas sp. CES TaxID=2719586 RepID=UPI00277B5934|nr:DUF3596 domain-containing protein [Pseudomonas sp. CES]